MASSPISRLQESRLLGALFSAPDRCLDQAALAQVAQLTVEQLPGALAPYVQAGYPIEFHPQGRVMLHPPPDVWCAEEILGRCPPHSGQPAWSPLLLVETGSTNDVAREQGRKGIAAGFVVAASRQTKGRGRLARAWESPPHLGLYVSLLLRPHLSAAEAGQLTVVSSVAASDAVENLSSLRPSIKWPNDLVIQGRKLAGMLIETEPGPGRLAFAVIGIGINVRQKAEDFSPEIRSLATSLYLATGQFYRRADMLVALLQAFEKRLAQPFAEVREAWAASSLTLGQQVTLTTLRGRKQGQALGLDATGALLLRTTSGEIETITAGDMQAV